MANAVGMVEVYGLVAAFAAGDAGCKAADVVIEAFDRNKPANADTLEVPLIVMVKFRGDVEAVKAAVEAGSEAAKQVSGVISTHIIASPEDEINPFLQLNGLDKKQPTKTIAPDMERSEVMENNKTDKKVKTGRQPKKQAAAKETAKTDKNAKKRQTKGKETEK